MTGRSTAVNPHLLVVPLQLSAHPPALATRMPRSVSGACHLMDALLDQHFPPHPPPSTARFCSNDSLVIRRCPTPSGTFMRALRRKPSFRRPAAGWQQASPRSPGSRAQRSFQACLGSADHGDRIGPGDTAPVHVAFRQCKSVSVPIASFRSSILQLHPGPAAYASLNTSRCATQNSTWFATLLRAGLFHSLLHAGLSRRTALAILSLIERAATGQVQNPICPIRRFIVQVDRPIAELSGFRVR